MTKSTLLLAFTSTFALIASFAEAAEPPDRCAKLGEDGYPLLCDPIGEHIAPPWHAPVCCQDDVCSPQLTGECLEGASSFTCDYAEIDALDQVTCLFLVPHYCDEHACQPLSAGDLQQPPQALEICCYEEGCYAPEGDICAGVLYWCDYGSTNEDGTITCDDG